MQALSPPHVAWPRRVVLPIVVRLVGGSAFVVALVAAGRLALARPKLTLAASGAFFAAAVMATNPLLIATAAVPGVWVVQRVGGGGIDMSGSDVLIVLGTICAVPAAPWRDRRLTKMLHAVLIFEAVLLLTVIAHPTLPGLFEWGHRLFLTGGSIVIGATVARTGRFRAALTSFLVIAVVMAFLSVIHSIATGFSPAAVLGFHKNFLGSMMVAALAVSYLSPGSTGLSKGALLVVKGAAVLGLLASQSRGAILALLVGLIVASVRSREVRRRSVGIFIVLVPLAVFASFSLRTQLEVQQETGYSSLVERERFRDAALEAWRDSPVFGQGMRFFTTGEHTLQSDPHNVIVASLSETGVVGLVALLALVAVAAGITAKIRTSLGVAALALILARFAHGLFDIFWVASTQALPWLIVGMAIGERSREGGADSTAELKPAAAGTGGA